MPAKVSLRHLIQDRHYRRESREILLATPVKFYTAPDDGQFRDRPVHARVAVVAAQNTRHVPRDSQFAGQRSGVRDRPRLFALALRPRLRQLH